jgi:hypothetical protein
MDRIDIRKPVLFGTRSHRTSIIPQVLKAYPQKVVDEEGKDTSIMESMTPQ